MGPRVDGPSTRATRLLNREAVRERGAPEARLPSRARNSALARGRAIVERNGVEFVDEGREDTEIGSPRRNELS